MGVGMCVGLWVGRGAEARAVPRSARQRRERFGRRGWRSDRKVCRGEAVLLLLWVLWLLWLFKGGKRAGGGGGERIMAPGVGEGAGGLGLEEGIREAWSEGFEGEVLEGLGEKLPDRFRLLLLRLQLLLTMLLLFPMAPPS